MNCKICDKLIISTAVADTDTGIVITIPSGSYGDGCRYCIVIAQSIPTTATIGETVSIQIGTGTDTYQLVGKNCRPITACGIHSRCKYPVIVETTATGGVFRLINSCGSCAVDTLSALEG